MAYMALVLAKLKFLAILLFGNIADSVTFKSSFAHTGETDFSVNIFSTFIQPALWKCISNVFWICSYEIIVYPLDLVDSSDEGIDFGLETFFLFSTIAICIWL